MSKDKRKRKFFQGMEHLADQAQKNVSAPTIQQSAGTDPASSLEHAYVRRDLFGVLVMMSVIALILVGLTILDKKTDKLTVFAEKITSIVIK
jgi:hypothetical protein